MTNFKKAFAKTIMSLEQIEFLWSLFEDTFKHSDPVKAFMYANRDEFKKDIYTFIPLLTPFHDYGHWISKLTLTEKNIKVYIDKMLVNNDKIRCQDYVSIIDGKKKVIKEIEYFRLVLVHVLAAPRDKRKSPFVVFKTVSEPKRFKTDKSYKISIPLPEKHRNDFYEYRKIKAFAFCYNFTYDKEIDKKGNEVLVESVFSCSDSNSFDAEIL